MGSQITITHRRGSTIRNLKETNTGAEYTRLNTKKPNVTSATPTAPEGYEVVQYVAEHDTTIVIGMPSADFYKNSIVEDADGNQYVPFLITD